jgi:hypothetical protein
MCLNLWEIHFGECQNRKEITFEECPKIITMQVTFMWLIVAAIYEIMKTIHEL